MIDAQRLNRVLDGAQPRITNLINFLSHAERVNSRRGRQRAHHNWHIVLAAFGIDDVGEKKCTPLVGRHAAEKLPPHQRMQFGVLIDRTIYAKQKALRFKVAQMRLQI